MTHEGSEVCNELSNLHDPIFDGMLMVMLLVIIPKFSQVYSQLGAGLPAQQGK